MKRAEKINLITKLIQGKVSEEDIRQLRQSNGPGAVVIICKGERPGPDDAVSFDHNGQRVTMPYKDVQAFTRYEPLTVFLLPAKVDA